MRRGFTLIELMLSLALLSIVAALSAPFFAIIQRRNDLNIAQNTVAQSLRRAQVLSQSVSHDSSWGVYVGDDLVVIFQGNSYLSRNSDYDEIFDIPNIDNSGLSEVVFSKLFGLPQSTGDILISNQDEAKTITINEQGILTY